MTPTPQEHAETMTDGKPGVPLPGEEVVISGMAGLMPSCENLEEFSRKLYDKVNFVKETAPRWGFSHPELPNFAGTIPGLERFDNQFFSVNQRLANNVDCMSRQLLELSYGALFDAACTLLNAEYCTVQIASNIKVPLKLLRVVWRRCITYKEPARNVSQRNNFREDQMFGVAAKELSGKKVGVFVATSLSEAEQGVSTRLGKDGITGCNRAMFANRISYYLNTTGPSLAVDCNGCGAMVALEQAHRSIQQGLCDSAIVGASKILLLPQSLLHHGRALPINKVGETRCYDKNADGHAMSEAIHIIYLQKQKNAKRVYATLCHVKTAYNKLQRQKDLEIGFLREPKSFENFLRVFYEDAGVPSSSVQYVEGFGSGIPHTDMAELEVIENIFAKDSKSPVLVGSVSSNIGWTEAASGLSSMSKVLLAHQTGYIAPNLHFQDPHDIKAFQDNKLRIVTEKEKFDCTYSAINSFSFMGTYGHALLKRHYIPKDENKYKTEMPYILTISGRHKPAINKIFKWVSEHPIDPEEIYLLNDIHKNKIKLHLARGFAIYKKVPNQVPEILKADLDVHNDIRCPLWFVYSGMGSQWAGMGKELMAIPVFAESIQRCDKILSAKGIDIVDIITSKEKPIFDNILHSFVGIAAVQIGITNVLKTVGILPDKIIGHSVGELGCAYADGCITADEMILLAYYRGLVSLETPLVRGSMAAVGLSYKQVSKLLPPEIDVACHNSAESSTISGPADVMQKFVGQLVSQGIFAKEVACSNIAYHSRYIAKAGPYLEKYCKQVITTPKLRSDRWISTSVPQEEWATRAKYSSAEYHVNNLLSPVLFEEMSQLIPNNAVLIEIAPHSLLQGIFQRSLPKDAQYIPLTRRSHPNNAAFLLEGLGKLFQKGYSVDVNTLYPKVEYPVSTETRSLSQLVDWEHSNEWFTFMQRDDNRHQTSIYNPIVTLHDEEYKYMRGYSMQGKIVMPCAAILNYVWDTLAMVLNVQKDLIPVKFENVHFYSQPLMTEKSSVHLSVQFQRISGQFEVTYEQGIIATGYVGVEEPKNLGINGHHLQPQDMDIDSTTVYGRLSERGYQFKDAFKVIEKADKQLTRAQVAWAKNYVTFIEGVLQVMILKTGHDGISKLEHIQNLTINNEALFVAKNCSNFEFSYDELENIARCGPVKIQNVTFKHVPCSVQDPIVRCQKFIPFVQNKTDYDNLTNFYIYLQIVSENKNKDVVKVCEIKNHEDSILDKIDELNTSPADKILDKTVLSQNQINNLTENDFINVDVVIINRIDSETKIFETLHKVLAQNTFIINISLNTKKLYPVAIYKVVASIDNKPDKIELAIWRQTMPTASTAITVKSDAHFAFLRETHANLLPTHKLLVFTSYPPPVGFKELIKELRNRKSGCNQVLAVIVDEASPKTALEESANFDLAFSVLRQGKLGGEYLVPECKNMTESIPNVVLQIEKPGDLSSLSWVEAPQSTGAGIPIQVYFAGLNVYDAKVALAEIIPPSNEGFGIDFSGVTERGALVMGMVTSGAATAVVKANPELLWPVPAHWSLEDAATVPLPYCIAFYCLGIVVNLHRRQKIFVHGGAGAVGQAVISIALAHGCHVFTTVSDLQKKRFLKRLFPDLSADHIGNSRDESFSDMVLMKTMGVGCDIIISSVKGELKNSTLKCCSASGTTIDLVQMHTREDFQYGMSNMTLARSYVPIDFAAILKQSDTRGIFQKLHSMVSEGIREGYVRPLSRVTFDAKEASRGLNLLATSRHRGRVLLNIKTLTPENVVPKISCSPDKAKLIICDEQDLSHQLVDKLIEHGAKKFIVHSTKPSAIFNFKNEGWKNLGAQVSLFSNKIIDKNVIQDLFKDASKLGPVDGIYIVSMDTNSTLRYAIADLDDASRKLASSLRHFAVITEDQHTGYETYVNRIQNKLPCCRIQLSNPEKYELVEEPTNSKPLSNKSSLKAIMTILNQEDASVLLYADPTPESSVLAELKKITDVSTENVDDETTLEDLGINENNAQLVCNLAENKFGIYLKKSDVPKMTIRRLKSLETNLNSVNITADGLEGQFSFIDSDEITANWEIFRMKTYLQNSHMGITEFNMEATYLCIVPGLEGHHRRFEQLCERLKIRAMVLQPGFDKHHESLDDIAARLVEVMKARIGLKNEFYLLGYEFGAEIALRMARILEISGMTGTVFCLGGNPSEITTTLLSQLNCKTKEELEDLIVQHVYQKLKGKRLDEIKSKLNDAVNWQEKIKQCINMLKGVAMQSNQYIKDLLETLYSRITLLKENESIVQLLTSKIVFLRGDVLEKLPENIFLKMYGNNIIVHDIHAPLAELPVDLRIPEYVNKHLSQEILDEYNKSNRCETLLVNSNF